MKHLTIEVTTDKTESHFIHDCMIGGFRHNGVHTTDYIRQEQKSYYMDGFSEEDTVFAAKIEASKYDPDITSVYAKINNQILWGSDYPTRGDNCIRTLKSAEITDISSNCVDMSIRLTSESGFSCTYPLTVYCFYDNEECKRPIVGQVTFFNNIGQEINLMLNENERDALQSVLDRHDFEPNQFGTEYICEEEREVD